MGRFILAVLLVGIIFLGEVIPKPEEKIVFLDVGQGDAILLQNETAQVLIDGGMGDIVLHRLAEEVPFLDRRLDVVIITHPQRDHIGGLLHVLERYEVGLVVMPKVEYESQLYTQWKTMVEERRVEVVWGKAGQQIQLDELELSVLWPNNDPLTMEAISQDVNNASVTTRVDFHGLSLLLTGDLERRAERMLVAGTNADALDVNVLKAGHHGSNTSTHYELLRASTPSAVVISVGSDNSFGHPHKNVLARLDGIRIWRTDEDGTISFVWSGRRWHVQ